MSNGGARADADGGEYGVASVNRGWIRAIEVRKSPPRYPHGVFELYLGHREISASEQTLESHDQNSKKNFLSCYC